MASAEVCQHGLTVVVKLSNRNVVNYCWKQFVRSVTGVKAQQGYMS